MPERSRRKLCFVVGPIGDEGTDIRNHADWLLDGIIRPVFEDMPEFYLKRADEDRRPGLIDVQMINDLLNAELVIADLSLSNPNAFYEIGIRHMTQKPIIHMQLSTESTPFDVSLYRAIKFSRDKFSDLDKAKKELKSVLEAVLSSEYKPENPVTNALGRLKLEQNATPEVRLMMEDIDALKSQMSGMSDFVNRLASLTFNRGRVVSGLFPLTGSTPQSAVNNAGTNLGNVGGSANLPLFHGAYTSNAGMGGLGSISSASNADLSGLGSISSASGLNVDNASSTSNPNGTEPPEPSGTGAPTKRRR